MSSKSGSGGCLKKVVCFIALVAVIGYIGDKIDENKDKTDYYPDKYTEYTSADSLLDIPAATTSVSPSVTIPPLIKVPEELENVPASLRENVYLDYVGGGCCEKFSDNVELNIIFVTDNDSKWNSSAQSTAKTEIDEQRTRIKEAAAAAGVSLNLSVRYHSATIMGQSVTDNNTQNNWRDTAIRAAGLGDLLTAQTGIEASRGVSSAPIVFLFNQSGRATASHQATGSTGAETIILFSSGISSLFHEMCHLYGARDFYYPSDVEVLADKYLSDSIMNSGDTVDPLTAFIIGWTGSLSSSAEAFLRETSYVTSEYLKSEYEKETMTGYGTREYGGGTYTGNMVNGWPHGQGTKKDNNGSYYSGIWENGKFLNGECVIYYTDGTVFRGTKQNGVITGYGETIYSGGGWYKGNWADGKRNGYGEMRYSDGDVYKGNWKDGNRDGYGTYIYNNGTKEEGYYSNNKGNGQFVIYYASGAFFRGNKENGVITGYGEMTFANGNYYSGNWENGLPNGYGEMKYINGDVYKGNWKDNTRHGYGVYTWAGGSVRTGNWSNGEYVG